MTLEIRLYIIEIYTLYTLHTHSHAISDVVSMNNLRKKYNNNNNLHGLM